MKNWKVIVMVMIGFSALQACDKEDDDIDRGEEREFVVKAANSNMFEIEAGKLAQQKSSNEAVKGFGLLMINDHTQASAELSVIAADNNIAVPATMDEAHQTKLNQLGELNGAAFDKLYAQEMVSAHQNAIELFEEANEDLDNMDLKNFAASMLPALRSHLEMANQLVIAVNP